MSQIFVPGQQPVHVGPYNQSFFMKEFKEGQVPRHEEIKSGETPVVELQLLSGETCDVYCFERFKREFIVAQIYSNPQSSDDHYRSYIRYDTIFKINIKQYKQNSRPLGFHPAKPEVEDN